MVIRETKVLRHVGVGLEAPPNGKAVVITQRFVKTKTDLNTHTHTRQNRLQKILDLFHLGRTQLKTIWVEQLGAELESSTFIVSFIPEQVLNPAYQAIWLWAQATQSEQSQ